MKAPAFYACPPAHPRIQGTNLGTCQLCKEPVQYKPGGPEVAELHHGQPITMICMACATREIPAALARPQ